jgi:hypothetical protein
VKHPATTEDVYRAREAGPMRGRHYEPGDVLNPDLFRGARNPAVGRTVRNRGLGYQEGIDGHADGEDALKELVERGLVCPPGGCPDCEEPAK